MTTTERPIPDLVANDPAQGQPDPTDTAALRAGEPEPSPGQRAVAGVVGALASLKLTVTLFSLGIFLIFAGTLAQVRAGIWTVMEDYFRTPIAMIDLSIFAPEAVDLPGVLPFPGGYLLGGLLLLNLLAAHTMRFSLTAKRSGIWLIHTGLIVLILSEFVTGLMAEEGQMTIREGGASNYVVDIRETELAVIDKSDVAFDRVWAIPESRYDDAGTGEAVRIDAEQLPFELRVIDYMVNSELLGAEGMGAGLANPATAGEGRVIVARETPEVAGTSPTQAANEAAAYVEAIDRETGESLGTYLTSVRFGHGDLRPQVIRHRGRTYHLFLRFQRTYKPYAFHLIDFKHDRYLGTDKPKNFSSHLRLIDPSHNENREVVIKMNHPLRYRGETFYQAAFLQDDSGTVLQVVDNPGWLMPYISCGMIVAGLAVHFVIGLVRFGGRRAKA